MSDDPRWTRGSYPVPNLILVGLMGLLVGNVGFFPGWLKGLGILVWAVCFGWQIRIDIERWWARRH